MELNITIGQKYIIEQSVGISETAKAYGSGDLDVYATPAMIALMENAAKSCVQNKLPEGFTTVGIEINVRHMKATPLGMKVKAEAIFERAEGKKLFFKTAAYDEKGTIGEGTHIRYVVNSEEFMNRLKR